MIGLLSSDGCKEAERRSERGSGILNINTNKIVQRRADALVFQSLVWSPPLYSIKNADFVTWRTAQKLVDGKVFCPDLECKNVRCQQLSS